VIEVWKRIAAAFDWCSVVDCDRGLEPADLKTCLAKRLLAQLMPA
jgi:hypothetical protein